MLLCPFCQETSLACLTSAVLMSFGHVSFMLIIFCPYSFLRFASLGRLFHCLSSHKKLLLLALRLLSTLWLPTLCRFHASLTSSSRCPVQATCAQLHVPTPATWCSISKLFTSKNKESETEGFFSYCAGQLSSHIFSLGRHHAQSFKPTHSSWHNSHAQDFFF